MLLCLKNIKEKEASARVRYFGDTLGYEDGYIITFHDNTYIFITISDYNKLL